jgi:hypothetical protein
VLDAECIKCYKDRLHDEAVFESFAAMAKQAKKTVAKSSAELREQVIWNENMIA